MSNNHIDPDLAVEVFILDPLASDCATDGRYTFLLEATPLPLTRGLGTPLNPVALK